MNKKLKKSIRVLAGTLAAILASTGVIQGTMVDQITAGLVALGTLGWHIYREIVE